MVLMLLLLQIDNLLIRFKHRTNASLRVHDQQITLHSPQTSAHGRARARVARCAVAPVCVFANQGSGGE